MTTRRALLLSSAHASALAVTPILAACGTPGSSTEALPAAKLKTGSLVTFWSDQGGGQPAIMQDWAQRFEKQTGVKVEATGGIADWQNKLVAAFTAGTPPDVFRYLQEQIPIVAAVERGMFLKLDPYIKRDKYDLTDFRKDAVVLYQWKGAQYALPRAYGLQLVFYNTDTFQREGIQPLPIDWNEKTWTFQRLQEVSQRLSRAGEQRYALFVPRGSRLWASFVYSNGGAIVKKNADGLATEFAIHEGPAVEALQFMQDLIYKHNVAPEPSQEAALGNQLTLIQTGKLALQITNPGANLNFKNSKMPYDAAPFPLGPKGTRRGVGGGGTGYGAAGPTKLPEEAWSLLAFITSKEAQMDELREGSTTPVRISLGNSPDYISPPPRGAKLFSDGQEFVVRDPVHTRWPDVERDVVNKLLNEELWSGKSSAAQVTRRIKELGDPFFK
ncbi:MAG TPA: extracellular solute-binding protein [Chloroflexota bacterium]|jgi:multiple sugar transport system substrate-binding protein|nr:extracellular solute-binding protein [Chloroflexota bacterium]